MGERKIVVIKQGGFVILEALIAIVVMAVALTALMQALMNNARVINTVQDYGKAWLLINEKLGEKTLFDTTIVPLLNQPAAKPLERFTYDLEFKSINQESWQGLERAEMSVAWIDGKQRVVNLRTILPDDNSTQTTRSVFYN